MNKDQTLGAVIVLACLLLSVFYAVTLFYPQWLNMFGMEVAQSNVQFWVIAVPVLIVFLAILAIGSWIGWTMATTPPPKPIEALRTETEQKDADKEAAS